MAHVLCNQIVISINSVMGDMSTYGMVSDFLNITEIVDSSSNSEILQMIVKSKDKDHNYIVTIRGNSYNNPEIAVHYVANQINEYTNLSLAEADAVKTAFSIGLNSKTNTITINKM
jgi:hypothetical protein